MDAHALDSESRVYVGVRSLCYSVVYIIAFIFIYARIMFCFCFDLLIYIRILEK